MPGPLTDSQERAIQALIADALEGYFTQRRYPNLGPQRIVIPNLADLDTQHLDGPVTWPIGVSECVFSCDTTAGDVDLTLPLASAWKQLVVVVNESDTAYQTNINTSGGNSIGPSGPVSLTRQREYIILVSDGVSTWNVISRGVWNGPVGGNATLSITIDGGGGVPTTGSKGFVVVPFAGTITHWYIIGDASGSAVVDLKRSGTSIIGGGGNKPTLSSAQRADDSPSGWTSVAIAENDEIEFNLDSASTLTRINLFVKVAKA